MTEPRDSLTLGGWKGAVSREWVGLCEPRIENQQQQQQKQQQKLEKKADLRNKKKKAVAVAMTKTTHITTRVWCNCCMGGLGGSAPISQATQHAPCESVHGPVVSWVLHHLRHQRKTRSSENRPQLQRRLRLRLRVQPEQSARRSPASLISRTDGPKKLDALDRGERQERDP